MEKNEEVVFKKIMAAIREISDFDAEEEIKKSDRLREDLGLDSVQGMMLMEVLSKEFGLKAKIEDVASIATIQDLIQFITKKT